MEPAFKQSPRSTLGMVRYWHTCNFQRRSRTNGEIMSSIQPRVPYAMESLRIIAHCHREMIAWLRYALGSHVGDDVVKVDIDLCDDEGNVCVEMRGFSYRILKSEQVRQLSAPRESQSELQSFVPVWNPVHPETHKLLSGSTKILLLAAEHAELDWMQRSHPNAYLVQLPSAATIDSGLRRMSSEPMVGPRNPTNG